MGSSPSGVVGGAFSESELSLSLSFVAEVSSAKGFLGGLSWGLRSWISLLLLSLLLSGSMVVVMVVVVWCQSGEVESGLIEGLTPRKKVK